MYALSVVTLILGGCSEPEPEGGPDTGTCPYLWGATVCADGVTVSGSTTRVLPAPVASLPSRGVSIAVGDLSGTSSNQLYVGTGTSLTRLDGEGFSVATELWSSGSGSVYPLVADLTGDGLPDLALGIPGSDDHAGQILVFPGPVREPLDWDSPHFELQGNGGSGHGMSTADLDGDGLLDLVTNGQVRFGPIVADLPLGSEGDAVWADGVFVERHGSAMAGDVDGDGRADLVFLVTGPPATDDCDDYPVAVFVVPGPLSPGQFTLDGVHLTVPFPADTMFVEGAWSDGTLLRVVDLDGDSDGDAVADVIVTALDISGGRVPEVLVYSGPLVAGAAPSARFGVIGYLAATGDLDGDGIADLLQADFGGSFYLGEVSPEPAVPTLLHGPLADLPRFDTDSCEFHADALWSSPTLGAAWTGDLDGDGLADAVVTTGEVTTESGTTDAGVVILFGGR